ncbi:MAG: zinc-binding dehydrogenase [Armatimonadota bacterium]|nr:zinc-binding dehydrogenase [Armatimonadota bacterium]
MNDVLRRYKTLDYPLPSTNLAWRMHEAGVENFGKTGEPDVLPLRRPNRDEVLVRVDAIGICFSDVKLITQGPAHPRITGRDLAKEPVIPGHEVSLTVVEAGDDYKSSYKPGDRFIVQADVYYKGVNLAYGYALEGGMQQYGIVGEPVLAGDEGSYLIPVKPETGYAEAALVEPWTCVVAAYRIQPRKTWKPGGAVLIVQTERGEYCFDPELWSAGLPQKIVLSGVDAAVASAIEAALRSEADITKLPLVDLNSLSSAVQEHAGGRGFDDIVVLGTPDPSLAEALAAVLAKNGVMAILAEEPIGKPVKIDIGRVHYDYIDIIGSRSHRVADAYSKSRTSELTPGGAAWFIGAAGPMGQMHVQRAVRLKNGPCKILCTDVDDSRLDYLRSGVDSTARERGIEIKYVNPTRTVPDELDKIVAELTSGRGFDDIVVMAPVAAIIEDAVRYLAEGGLLNIFAGVPRGTIATMDISSTYLKGNRFVGSSGSRPQDMVDTLALTEAGELPVVNSLAAIGGIDAVAEGVRAVKEARFPGKIVIFPHIRLPLTALTDLNKVAPNVFAKLKDGKFWTKEAEEELLRSRLEL